eukprot:3707997-Amphidinium_carterae.1
MGFMFEIGTTYGTISPQIHCVSFQNSGCVVLAGAGFAAWVLVQFLAPMTDSFGHDCRKQSVVGVGYAFSCRVLSLKRK